jgi:HSP20 family molecular chaperone IbpA
MSRSKKVFVARLIPDSLFQRTSGPLWQPAADIYRCPQGYKIKFDLAGVKPEDLEVLVGENRIIVRGVRRDSVLTQGWSYQQLEITYSRFERVLQIPYDLSKAEIRVESIDGWLLVHIDYAAQMLEEEGESPEE